MSEIGTTESNNASHTHIGGEAMTASHLIHLQTCDIILWINEKNDPINRLSRWAIGPYSHVAMYLGWWPFPVGNSLLGIPLVYESRGRGIYIASLLPQTGMSAAVMRPRALTHDAYHVEAPNHVKQALMKWTKEQLLNTAFEMAADEKHFYDYIAIVHSVLPRVIAEKLRLPLPIKYHRDIFFICSEAVAELWWRNDTLVLPDDYQDEEGVIHAGSIPLPGDFANSRLLKYIGKGKLMEDIVP